MTDKTGGPAFPLLISNQRDRCVRMFGETVEPGTDCQFTGVSTRDYFAIKALETVGAIYTREDLVTWDYRHFAEHAYRMADAMLAERDK
jgi:hypothetical protein